MIQNKEIYMSYLNMSVTVCPCVYSSVASLLSYSLEPDYVLTKGISAFSSWLNSTLKL